jgi:hypothetical protein
MWVIAVPVEAIETFTLFHQAKECFETFVFLLRYAMIETPSSSREVNIVQWKAAAL